MLKAGVVLAGTEGRRWKVGHLLGKGTCCEVYQVQLQGEDFQAAVKVYKRGHQYQAAHDREYLLLQLLHCDRYSCPEIVTVLDNFSHDRRSCLVQEQLDCNLKQIITKNQGQGLSFYLLQKLTRDMLRGLEQLHKLGFVHGDLKPCNLLYNPKTGRLELIDFSLSFHQQDEEIGMLQSFGYRAPEAEIWNQKLMAADASLRSERHTPPGGSIRRGEIARPNILADIWSLGCLLVEIYTASKLFTKQSLDEIERVQRLVDRQSILDAKVDHALRARTMTDSDSDSDHSLLKDLCHRMLVLDPAKRISVSDALRHPLYFSPQVASFTDLLLLPSCVLRLLNMFDSQPLLDEELYKDIKTDIEEECEKFGNIISCVIPDSGRGKGKVFVEFASVEQSMTAFEALCHKTFSGRTVLLTYFCTRDFYQRNYY